MWTKLLFNRETISFGKHATLDDDFKPYNDEERRIVKGHIDRIYQAFLEVVGKARGMSVDEVDPIAGGRVWTGRQAHERKLVDELGGLDAAISKARSLGGLKDDAPVREVWASKRMMPPAAGGAATYVAYMIESLGLLSRAPALAVMDYLPGELT
jgi:protease-4